MKLGKIAFLLVSTFFVLPISSMNQNAVKNSCSQIKGLTELLFLKSQETNLGGSFNFQHLLMVKNCGVLGDMADANNAILGTALAMCDDSTCELMTMAIPDKNQRNKGYGTIFIQEILSYLKKNTQAKELGLLAEPMGHIYETKTPFFEKLSNFIMHPTNAQRVRLRNFYKRNGAQSVADAPSEDILVFFLNRENKIN